MRIVTIEKPKRFLRNKKELEDELNVKLTIKTDTVEIKGSESDEYDAEQIFLALEYGFSLRDALTLKDPNFILQIVNIKDLTKRQNREEIRARIIGTEGRALRTLTNLTQCKFKLHDNTVAIIGHTENIEEAIQSLTSLIKGSKHSKVYSRLERLKTENKNKENLPVKEYIEDEFKT